MEKKFNRVLCLALALIMVIGFIPMHHAHAAVSTAPTYHWVMSNGTMVDAGTEGTTANALTVPEGVNYGYKLDKPVELDHTKDWIIEIDAGDEHATNVMYFSEDGTTNKSEDAHIKYLYRSGSSFIAFGYPASNSGSYQNAAALADDGAHKYIIFNRYDAEKATNTIYLSLDGATATPMNTYCSGATVKDNTTDLALNKDFVFGYLGASGFAFNKNTNYVKVWEDVSSCPHFAEWVKNDETNAWDYICPVCGYSETRDSLAYRWNNVDGTMVSDTSDDYVVNGLSRTDNGYKMDEAVTLKYTENWAIEFAAQPGNARSILLSESGSVGKGMYLFYPDKESSNKVYFGKNVSNTYVNMGCGIQTVSGELNTYRITNRYDTTNATNTIWISVNGGAPVKMETMYHGNNFAADETTTWHKTDFAFGYMGVSGYTWRNDIAYMEIVLNNAHCEHSYDIAEDGQTFTCKMCGDVQSIESYYWKNVDGIMTSVTEDGATLNTLKTNGAIGYEMTYPAALYHNNEWAVEFKFSPTGASMPLSQAGNVNDGNKYLYWNGGFLGLGYVDSDNSSGKPYQNFAASVKNGEDTKVRLMNKVNTDGTNMVYVSLNDGEPKPMTSFYQNTKHIEDNNTSLNEMDFVFKFLGSTGGGFEFDTTTEYMRIWLDDQPCPHYNTGLTADENGDLVGECSFCGEELFEDVKSFRWENVNGTMVSASGEGITQNTLTKNSTIGYKMAHPAVLKYNENWAIEFTALEGGAKSMVLSESGKSGSDFYVFYPDTDSATDRFYIGANTTGVGYLNMGCNIHMQEGELNKYEIMNRYDEATGTNSIWISVNDATPVEMNTMYVAHSKASDQETTHNGKNFEFAYLGASGFPWRSDSTYMQIWTEDAPCIHNYTTSLNEDNHMEKVCDWCGHVAESVEHYSFRWENNGTTFDSISGDDIMENSLTKAGTYGYELEHAALLKHNENWEIEFSLPAITKESMIFSESGDSSSGMYLYLPTPGQAKRLYFGMKNGSFYNMGCDHTVTEGPYKFNIKNEYVEGSGNTIWLSVNDGEPVKMNKMSNANGGWYSEPPVELYLNKTFEFTHMGTSSHTFAFNTTYLQVWPNGRPVCEHEFDAWAVVENQLKRTCGKCSAVETAKVGVNKEGVYTGYQSFDEALTAVEAGGIIRLFADITLNADLTLPAYVNLDLNGHTLESAHYFEVGQYGLIANDAVGGMLKVGKENVKFSGDNGRYLPIWSGDGYVLAYVIGNQYKERPNTADNSTKYYFTAKLPESVHEYIVKGEAETGVALKIEMSWTKGEVPGSTVLSYSDELVKTYYEGYEDGTYKYAFVLTVTGTDHVDAGSLEFRPFFTSRADNQIDVLR